MRDLLKIELTGYWHAGGGRDEGAVLDAVVHRDAAGRPVLPGRHLKGLLRDALARAEGWGWPGCERGVTAGFFGDLPGEAEGLPRPGALRVGDARLPGVLAAWLAAAEGGRAYLPELFRGLHATAVEPDTGTAKDRSLRGIEVTVPLALEAEIGVVPGAQVRDDWREVICGILPLVDSVGAYRNRGLGRALLKLEEVK